MTPSSLRSRRLAAVTIAGAIALGVAAACGTSDAPNPFSSGEGGQGGGTGGSGIGGDGGAPTEFDPTLGGPCTVSSQCDDGIACTLDTCDADLGRCRFSPDDAGCQNALVCDGQERCSHKNGCIPGEPKTCSDGSPCTIDTCDEASGMCASEPRDADSDGDPDVHCGGGDCADEDPLVSSKQSEVCQNGLDDDCDGAVDEAQCGKPKNDTCVSALALAMPGTYAMTTVAAALDYGSSCTLANPPAARDVVATLAVPAGLHDVQLTARSDFSDVTVTLAGTCGQPGTEIGCSPGYMHPLGGRVAKMRARSIEGGMALPFPAYVATDSPANVTLRYELLPASVKPSNETCGTALPLTDGEPVAASLVGVSKDLQSACQMSTGELVYRFELTEARDVDLFASSSDGDGRPILSLRRSGCALATDEITCGVSPGAFSSAHVFRHALEPGVYYVAVASTAPTDALVTLQTSPATPLPPDEICATAPILAAGVTLDVPLTGHQDDVGSSCVPGGIDAAYSLTLAGPSDVLVVGRFSQGDGAGVALSKGNCGAGDQFACAPGYLSPTRARAHGLAAGTYRIVAESQKAQPMQLTAFVRPAMPTILVPFADGCADALTIPVSGGFFQGNTTGATADFNAGCDQGKQPPGGAPDRLLRLVLPAPKRVAFDMQGSGYPTILSVRKGPDCPGAEIAKACAVGYYPDRSFLDLTLAAGTYFVQIDGFAGQYGPWFLDVFVTEPPK